MNGGNNAHSVKVTISSNAKILITIALPAAIVILTLWKQIHTSEPLPPVRIVGMVLAIGGFLFWAAARIQLSSSFAIRAKATDLVTTGLYARIRNPVYLFGSIFAAGLILWIGKPVWLVALCFLIPMQIVRARSEAKVLEDKFSDLYRDYRAKTWF